MAATHISFVTPSPGEGNEGGMPVVSSARQKFLKFLTESLQRRKA